MRVWKREGSIALLFFAANLYELFTALFEA